MIDVQAAMPILGLPEGQIMERVPLAPYTTIKVGGPARLFYEVRDGRELARLLRQARQQNLPVLVIGRGSNMLIADTGFDGLVVHFGGSFAQVELDGSTVTAQAGASLMSLARMVSEHGLAGLEFAAGIPASVGGASLMNAGAYGGEMAKVVRHVDCLDREGRPLRLSGDELQYGYRHSRMMHEGYTVLSTTMELHPDDREAVLARLEELQQQRRSKQPLNYPSAGSFFKRPPGYYAAQLIDQCGLKGLKVGGAEVSGLHCGFLLNMGGATSADVLKLAELVKGRVHERFGVELEPEVRIIGARLP